MLTQALRSKVKALWNHFWSGGIANPLSAIEQISYLLFMRRLDALDEKRRGDAVFTGQPFTSLFAGQYETRRRETRDAEELRWSRFRHLPAEEMLEHVRDNVFPFIKGIEGEEGNFAQYMQDAVFIIPKASLLVEAVGIIDELFAELERERQEGGQNFQDLQGDLYEFLLSEIASAGKNGQFRTPRHIIQMIVSLVNPKLGDAICDPACGTGGFLLGAYQHLLTQFTSEEHRYVGEDGIERGSLGDQLTNPKQWEVLRESTFYGRDFDTTMVRIGLMNLMLHGIDRPDLAYMDTLSKRYKERDRYDVVLANPPFKGSIDKGDIHEELRLKTTKTELLFVNRIVDLLAVGGRAGVIVPDGVLFGSTTPQGPPEDPVTSQLQGIVKLPPGCSSRTRGEHGGADLREGWTHRARLVLSDGGRWLFARRQARQDRRERHPDVILEHHRQDTDDGQGVWSVDTGKGYLAQPYRRSRTRWRREPADWRGAREESRRIWMRLGDVEVRRGMRLEELCVIQSGGTPRRGNASYYGGGIPWAKISDLNAYDGLVRALKSQHAGGSGVDRGPPRAGGHVLLAMYGSVGKTAVGPMSLNQAILGIQVKLPEQLDKGYLLHWLQSIQEQLLLSANGVTQQNISATAVRALRIPLPPIAEQRRIAELLDRADAVRRKRRRAAGWSTSCCGRFSWRCSENTYYPVAQPVSRWRLRAVQELAAAPSCNCRWAIWVQPYKR